MKIKKGDKLLCIKDVVMTKSGKTMYYAGRVYESEEDNCITNEEGMISHAWYVEDNADEHFQLMRELSNVEKFKQISAQICKLYEAKNAAYGNSFGDTYKKLGIVSAVTRISDKYNRLCNLATNPDIDNLGESIDDTLRDMAAYCIMTLIELEK